METNLGQVVLVKDINTGTGDNYYSFYPESSYSDNFTKFDDQLYFTADDGENGDELWVSDGTAEGTQLLIDINPENNGGSNSISSNPRLH